MDLRNAILKAADHIEQRPETFEFWDNSIPEFCGAPGCALGWIGFFLDLKPGASAQGHVGPLLVPTAGSSAASRFYERMSEVAGDHDLWKRSPFACANTLRLYADKYHPSEQSA